MADAPVLGLLHPGEMGAAVGAALRSAGRRVLWASAGRSGATRARAAAAGLEDAGDLEALAARSDAILSICPPHAAVEVAAAVAATGFAGLYVDANAVAPATARALGGLVEAAGATFVDGGIVGPPPSAPGTTRLYLSGPAAPAAAAGLAGTALDARVVSPEVGAASALKAAYAAWTKGTAALVLAARALARSEGVEPALLDEWRRSLPELEQRSRQAARSAATKGWRWVVEMEEIAAALAAAGLPGGFHEAAAELFRRGLRLDRTADDDATLDAVLGALPDARN